MAWRWTSTSTWRTTPSWQPCELAWLLPTPSPCFTPLPPRPRTTHPPVTSSHPGLPRQHTAFTDALCTLPRFVPPSPTVTPTPRCLTPRPSTPSPTCRSSPPFPSSSHTVGVQLQYLVLQPRCIACIHHPPLRRVRMPHERQTSVQHLPHPLPASLAACLVPQTLD